MTGPLEAGDRPAHGVTGRLRPQSADGRRAQAGRRAEEVRVLVDAGTGVLPSYEELFEGQPVRRTGLGEVRLDPAGAADPARFRPPPGIEGPDQPFAGPGVAMPWLAGTRCAGRTASPPARWGSRSGTGRDHPARGRWRRRRWPGQVANARAFDVPPGAHSRGPLSHLGLTPAGAAKGAAGLGVAGASSLVGWLQKRPPQLTRSRAGDAEKNFHHPT